MCGSYGRKAFMKRCVFNFLRKSDRVLTVRISGGSLFHSAGTAILNAFEPAFFFEKDFETVDLFPRVLGLGEIRERRYPGSDRLRALKIKTFSLNKIRYSTGEPMEFLEFV